MGTHTDGSSAQIHPLLVRQFEREILHQWDIAQRSIGIMDTYLDGAGGTMDDFWFGMDAALGALGNISKIFFPSGNAKSFTLRRCHVMRQRYGITDDSLMQSRAARNGFEHFDERLDTWFHQSHRMNLMDRMVNASPGGFIGVDESDIARLYNSRPQVVTVFGKSLSFKELVDEVDVLVEKVKAIQRGTFGTPSI